MKRVIVSISDEVENRMREDCIYGFLLEGMTEEDAEKKVSEMDVAQVLGDLTNEDGAIFTVADE
jgi:hypothetical protein